MYFFDPNVKTETGPLDVYTYNLPFVLPVNELSQQTGDEKNMFLVYITIENKGNGIAYLDRLNFIYDPKVFNQEENKVLRNCYDYCGAKACTSSVTNNPTCSSDGTTTGKCLFQFTPTLIISNGEGYTIICNAYLPSNKPFIGKSTNLISVVTNYNYTQTFDEQIACIQTPGASCNSKCVENGYEGCGCFVVGEQPEDCTHIIGTTGPERYCPSGQECYCK